MKLSDLNENDYQVESNTSEEAPLSLSSLSESDYQVESPSQIEQPEEVALTPIVEQITTPAAGYMAGRAAQEGISKTGELAGRGLEKIAELGGTSPEQLKTIKQNFPEFKATDPIAELNKVLESARGTNVDVNRMYAEAETLLADKKITPDEYSKIVESAVLEENKYGQPTFAKPVSQSEMQKADTRVMDNLRKEAVSKEEQMLNELAQLKANEAIKKADFEYKITNATNQPLPKPIESELKSDIINKVKSNPQEFGFKGLQSEVLGDYDYKIKKEMEALQTPLAKTFPSLEGTSIVPAEEKAFQKILGMPSKADIPGNRLQEMLREFRDRGFTEEGQLSEKPAASMSTKVREKISELSPEAGKLMEAENVELGKLESLENAGYIKREGTGLKTNVVMTDTQRNKFVKDLSTAYDAASPTDITENLQALKDYLPEDQFKKLQLAGLKLAEKRGGGVDYINSNKINAILQSITKRSVSRGVATLPEAISAALPKVVTSAAKTLGKGAFKALPMLGAGIGGVAAQAAEEAIDSTTSGALPTTISTDVQGQPFAPFYEERGFTPEEAVKRAEVSKFQEEYGTQPKTIQQEYPSNLALEGMSDIVESPQITSQRKSLQKQQQMLEESRRLRDERRIETQKVKQLGALAPTYVEAPLKQVLKADNPSEIASIAQSMQASTDKASQEYSRVLSQIVDAPVSQKEAVLFGLNQQPAFRELLRKLKDKKETEEEVPLMLKGPA